MLILSLEKHFNCIHVESCFGKLSPGASIREDNGVKGNGEEEYCGDR